MNKSKFLKKSLAAVLAVMLIVAMIPLGASAATTASISDMTVAWQGGSGEAKLSGTEWTVDFPSTETNFVVMVTMKDGAGVPYYEDANTGETVAFTADEAGIFYAELNATDYSATKIITVNGDGSDGPTYTLTLNKVAKEGVNTIKSFVVEGSYGAAAIDNDASTISLVVPYGQEGPVTAEVKTTSAKVQGLNAGENVDAVERTGKDTFAVTITELNTASYLTVFAESGASKTYVITLKTAEGFSAFSVAGQSKAAGIEVDPDGEAAAKNVYVYMPYGTAATAKKAYKFTPTFTTAYASATVKGVKTDDTTKVALTSGKEINLADFCELGESENLNGKTMTLEISYTNQAAENWTVNFVVPQQNPAAELTAVRVMNFNSTLSGNTFTVEVPGVVDSYPLTFVGSKNATVQIVGQVIDPVALGDTGEASTGENDVDCSETVTLRVMSEEVDDNDNHTTIKDYKLVVKSGTPEQASMKSMILQDGDENNYEATISQSTNTITFTVPFANKAPADLADWKLFYTPSNGSVALGLKYSGAKVSAHTAEFADLLPETFSTKGTKVPNKGGDLTVLSVDTDDNILSAKTYNIVVLRDAAASGKSMTALTVTTADAYDDLKDGNQYSVKSVKSTISVPMPYKDYENAENVYLIPTLSDKAVAYVVDGSSATKLVAVEEDGGAPTAIALTDCDGSADDKYVTIMVVNEKAALDDAFVAADTGAIADLDGFKTAHVKDYTTYKLAVTQNKPRATATLKSVKVYDPESDTEETVKIGADYLTINVPYYMSATPVYLNYEVTGGEDVTYMAEGVEGAQPLVYEEDADGNVKANSTEFRITQNNLLVVKTGEDEYATVTAIVAKCEDPALTNVTRYVPQVTVAKPELGAEMTSFALGSAKGTINKDTHEITVNVPFGTEITALKPTFTVSKNASVYYGYDRVISGELAINFTNPVKLEVVSENEANSNVYTIKVTIADRFKDVPDDAWFAADVMTAADKGWINGYGDGTFGPMDTMRRGDFASMMARVMGADLSNYTESAFPDVKADSNWCAAIAYCAEQGYINGSTDGYFHPSDTITREQMAKIICEAKGLTQVTTPSKPFTDDAKIATWAKGYVYACAEAGIFEGDDQGNFNPKAQAIRCQAAAVLVRAFA